MPLTLSKSLLAWGNKVTERITHCTGSCHSFSGDLPLPLAFHLALSYRSVCEPRFWCSLPSFSSPISSAPPALIPLFLNSLPVSHLRVPSCCCVNCFHKPPSTKRLERCSVQGRSKNARCLSYVLLWNKQFHKTIFFFLSPWVFRLIGLN